MELNSSANIWLVLKFTPFQAHFAIEHLVVVYVLGAQYPYYFVVLTFA